MTKIVKPPSRSAVGTGMPRFFRLARVVVGITVACAAAGATAGILCGVAVAALLGGPNGVSYTRIFGTAAAIGAACGLILGPPAMFGFLRRVPLDRLFGEIIIGTTVGGLLGIPFGSLPLAVIGFAIAVGHLAYRFRAKTEPRQVRRD